MLWAIIIFVFAIVWVISIVDNGEASGFGAQEVWLYSTILTVGYMISRGLAKAGSRQPYDESGS